MRHSSGLSLTSNIESGTFTSPRLNNVLKVSNSMSNFLSAYLMHKVHAGLYPSLRMQRVWFQFLHTLGSATTAGQNNGDCQEAKWTYIIIMLQSMDVQKLTASKQSDKLYPLIYINFENSLSIQHLCECLTIFNTEWMASTITVGNYHQPEVLTADKVEKILSQWWIFS